MIFEGVNIIDFSARFSTDEKCMEYLSEIKWKNGYQCAKCGHGKYFEGKRPFGRCCTKCHYDESPTAHTLFHKVKFPMQKAFYIAFLVATSKKGISSYELSRKLSLRQKTCWLFKRKVMEAMKSSEKLPLTGKVEMDEFYVGGPEDEKRGRGNEKKKQVVLAIQVDQFGIHRSYAQVIPRADATELRAFADQTIDRNAAIRTDGWAGYHPLKEIYVKLKQDPSSQGENFPLVHRQIMMIKAWLRGIHHHCKHLQAYLDEFNYRFNRLKFMHSIFHKLILRMMEHPPTTYQNLKVI